MTTMLSSQQKPTTRDHITDRWWTSQVFLFIDLTAAGGGLHEEEEEKEGTPRLIACTPLLFSNCPLLPLT